jgi:hypothetical protein
MITDKASQHRLVHFLCRPPATSTKRILYVLGLARMEEHELTFVQWTVDTETRTLGWEWIGKDGVVSSSSLALYRIGGRMYPVGDAVFFNTATGGASSTKYEIFLKYVLV